MINTGLALLVLMVFALIAGAVVLWRRGGSRKNIGLMLLLAVVMAVNIAIWTLPDASGTTPLGQDIR